MTDENNTPDMEESMKEKTSVEIVPMKCYTCNKDLNSKEIELEYQRMLSEGVDPGKALDDLGIVRICCRTRFFNKPKTSTCRARILADKNKSVTKVKNLTGMPGIISGLDNESGGMRSKEILSRTLFFEKMLPTERRN